MNDISGVLTLKISIVIPHLNQSDMLEKCLQSLAEGSRKADEIFVVDNGSAQMPETVCNAFPTVTLLRETEPGPGPARNLGASVTDGDILAFIDVDCLADPAWLETAHTAMQDTTAEILGGDVRIAYVDPGRLTVLEAYESIYAYRMDRYIAREGYTGTGNLVVRKAVLQDVGPFAGITVAEDRDWGQRATAKGYQTRYVSGMKVYHPARTSFNGLKAKWDRHLAHEYHSATTRRFGRLRFLLKTLAMGLSPFAEIPRILRSDRISGIGDRFKAFAGLVRIRFYRMRVMASLLMGRDPEQVSGRWNRK